LADLGSNNRQLVLVRTLVSGSGSVANFRPNSFQVLLRIRLLRSSAVLSICFFQIDSSSCSCFWSSSSSFSPSSSFFSFSFSSSSFSFSCFLLLFY
jgi:hypothetical protein